MTSNSLGGLRTVLAAVVILLILCPLCAPASDGTIDQFVHTGWTAKDRASGVYALVQTADGFLWVGTARGLYRFDGLSFELYEPQTGPAFPSSNVLAYSRFRTATCGSAIAKMA